MSRWWFKAFAWLLDFPAPRFIFGGFAFIYGLYNILWTVLESSGIQGSREIPFLLLSISLLVFSILITVAHVFRWTILNAAVKEYVGRIYGTVIKEDTILVSAGAGGGLALGMVSKSLQKLNKPIPKCLVLDHEFRKGDEVQIGSLLPNSFNLKDRDALIVLSYVGTGQTLNGLRTKFTPENAQVFALAVSEYTLGRANIEHYLFKGRRSLIPWPKSTPNPPKII